MGLNPFKAAFVLFCFALFGLVWFGSVLFGLVWFGFLFCFVLFCFVLFLFVLFCFLFVYLFVCLFGLVFSGFTALKLPTLPRGQSFAIEKKKFQLDWKFHRLRRTFEILYLVATATIH